MSSHIRYGLIVGAVTFPIHLLISVGFGICGPFVTLTAGLIAANLTSRAEGLTSNVVRHSAISGGIVGGVLTVSQIIAALLALALLMNSDMELAYGRNPSPDDPFAVQAAYAGLMSMFGFCFGAFGTGLSAVGAAMLANMRLRHIVLNGGSQQPGP